MAAKKEPVYAPRGDELNPEMALSQASVLLDIAALRAVESNDTETLARIASGWIAIAKCINNMTDEYPHKTASKTVGFSGSEGR